MGANVKDKRTIIINKNWCKQCGICSALCPKNVLEVGEDGKPYVKDPEVCSGCGLCEARCPDFAITFQGAAHD